MPPRLALRYVPYSIMLLLLLHLMGRVKPGSTDGYKQRVCLLAAVWPQFILAVNVLVSVNEVTQRRIRLVLGWVDE